MVESLDRHCHVVGKRGRDRLASTRLRIRLINSRGDDACTGVAGGRSPRASPGGGRSATRQRHRSSLAAPSKKRGGGGKRRCPSAGGVPRQPPPPRSVPRHE